MGSPNPRIYWNRAATDTGNIDTTYSTGPSFAKYDAFGGSITLDSDLTPGMHFKSITGYRQIKWNIGIDLDRSEEHTSELQSLAYLVCRRPLEKKKPQIRQWP